MADMVLTEGNWCIQVREKTLELSSVVLPAPSPYLDIINNMPNLYDLCMHATL